MSANWQINIHILRVANIDTGSVIAIGNNYLIDWQTFSKTNAGFGRIAGDSNLLADFSLLVDDPDWQDMLCSAPVPANQMVLPGERKGS